MSLFLVAVAAWALALPTSAAPESGPMLQIDYSNPGLTPSHWTLLLHSDGSGHFHSERGDAHPNPQGGMEAPNVDRDLRLSAEFTARVFETASRHRWNVDECESHLKVAFQGWKKLTYHGSEGDGVCAFNFAKEKQMQELGDSLVEVADTILTGARLEVLQQHDRLGLDRELEVLAESVGRGPAPQLYPISGILQRLSVDQELLERVRKRAMVLLKQARE